MLLALRDIISRDRELPLRIGVNKGSVYAGEIGPAFRRTFTVMGDAVNLAARLMAKAGPGEIVATPDVVEGSRTLFEQTALEPFTRQGKARTGDRGRGRWCRRESRVDRRRASAAHRPRARAEPTSWRLGVRSRREWSRRRDRCRSGNGQEQAAGRVPPRSGHGPRDPQRVQALPVRHAVLRLADPPPGSARARGARRRRGRRRARSARGGASTPGRELALAHRRSARPGDRPFARGRAARGALSQAAPRGCGQRAPAGDRGGPHVVHHRGHALDRRGFA